ncbi:MULTISPECIES: hypothetical protein [Streptomyces]|nr:MULTISPECIES: hypothetical protein [Streptomyces]
MRSAREVRENVALFEAPVPEALRADLSRRGLLDARLPTGG